MSKKKKQSRRLNSNESQKGHSRHKCSTCKKTFQNKCECSTCKKAFPCQSALTQHSFVHLGSEEKAKIKEGWKNVCYFCNKKFRDLSKLFRHMPSHFLERPYKCPTCRKTFASNGNLTGHKRIHSKDEKIRCPFKCKTCNKSFTEKKSLTMHIKIVHLKQKDFKCSQCDKKFGRKSSMVIHINQIHLNYTYPCHHCLKTYSQRHTAIEHMRKFHYKN